MPQPGGLLVYRADYRCSHSIAISADPWPDRYRAPLCLPACGHRGADVQPDSTGTRSQ